MLLFGECNLVQTVHIENGNFAMPCTAARFTRRQDLQLIRGTICRSIHADQPDVVILPWALQRAQIRIEVNRNVVPILILLDKCADIICMERHPCAGIIDTRNSALVRHLFLQARTRGTAFRSQPLVSSRCSDCRHKHEEQNGDKRDTRPWRQILACARMTMLL